MGKQQSAKPAAEETDSGMKRLGRVKHPVLGECVRVSLRHWEGPLYPGAKGKHVWHEMLVPRDQGRWGAGPIVQGYDEHAQRVATIATSVSYINDLRRYGNFRWARSVPGV